MDELAFFKGDGTELMPLPLARSQWGKDTIHGVATAGALARTLEQAVAAHGRSDLVPTRMTTDLFRPARVAPCTFEATVVRESARLCLVDATMRQHDEVVARASSIFLKPTAPPPGALWQPTDVPSPPPSDLVPTSDDPDFPWLWSEGVGWSQKFDEHQNADRKAIWQTMVSLVAGEPFSPFVTAAAFADSTSLVCNWGTEGIGYINTDISLHLARLPVSAEVGLRVQTHVAVDGISAGSAVMFDRAGMIGTTSVTGLSNAARQVRLDDASFEDGPPAV